MSSQTDLNDFIHGNPDFINFRFHPNTFPVYLALIPWIYMIPTLLLILRIIGIYWKIGKNRKSDNLINSQLFLVLCLAQITCYVFFLLDFSLIRLPATGIFTSWCASVSPNHFLKTLFVSTFYVNYIAMIIPLLLPIIRLLVVVFPNDHSQLNGKLLRFAIPFAFIYPIFFTFYLFPALGVCKTMAYPYPFGAVGIFYIESYSAMQHSHFYLWNTLIWMFLAVSLNLFLLIKLVFVKRAIVRTQRSAQSYKAEFSISITTAAMIVFYVTNLGFGFAYVMYDMSSNYNSWATLFRPFGNDLETVVVPFVFYLTHPIFRREDPKFFKWIERRRHSADTLKIVPFSGGKSSF